MNGRMNVNFINMSMISSQRKYIFLLIVDTKKDKNKRNTLADMMIFFFKKLNILKFFVSHDTLTNSDLDSSTQLIKNGCFLRQLSSMRKPHKCFVFVYQNMCFPCYFIMYYLKAFAYSNIYF
jgi:hypothetical protein